MRIQAITSATAEAKQAAIKVKENTSQLFKRPSSLAVKQGKARLLFEKMIHLAEHKLSLAHQSTTADAQSAKERAEALAQEFFHMPGAMLSSDEIAQMWQESGCSDSREQPECDFSTLNQFRTIDGTCNNLDNPTLGAATTAFARLTPPEYEDGVSSLRGDLQARNKFLNIGPFSPPNPSARLISETVVRNITQEELPFTHILMQFGQFLDHDLDLSPELEVECDGCTFTEVCSPIRVADLDKTFGTGTRNNAECLRFRRSLPVCDTNPPLSFTPREQINDITSFIDGSMIYGSTNEVASRVRAFSSGLLRSGSPFPKGQDSLPVDTDGIVACPNGMDCFLCGDIRCNEHISLTVMHTVWLREHNRCAREMAIVNPHWQDERLYQECRKIVGALIQKIVYFDYLPKVLGPQNFETFIGPYPGYQPSVDPSIPNSFATAAYRYGHSLVRPQFDRLDSNFRPLAIGPLNLVDAFFNPTQFRTSLGTDPILRGLVTENSLRMDEFLNMVLTKKLFQTPLTLGMDLASLNLQRGRDHGLQPYPIWRNFCARIFGDVSEFENKLTLVRFLQLYGSLDTLDLWIGGIAEDRLPESLLGATFACIFGLTFQRVRNGDRFYFERPGVFQPDQLAEIKKGSLSRVICDNSDNVNFIQGDAFLSNTSRVSCNQIPAIDLNRWRENSCFFNVRVDPRPFEVPISSFSRMSPGQDFVFSVEHVPANSRAVFQCVQLQCPSANFGTDLIAFSDRRFETSLQISFSNVLPVSVLQTKSSYRSTLMEKLFNERASGLFRSEEECRESSQAAFIFAFRNSAIAQSTEELVSMMEGYTKEKITLPKEILGIISNDKHVTVEPLEKEIVKESSVEDLKTLLKELN